MSPSSSLPVTDQMWLASAPTVHGPFCISPTPVDPRAPLVRGDAVGRGRDRNAGPTPQISPAAVGFFGEKKKLCVVAPSPTLWSEVRRDVVLVDDRQDGARDQVPVLADRDRDHRLDVQIVLLAVLGREVAVVVELERHADQARHRVGQLLGEVGVALGEGRERRGRPRGPGRRTGARARSSFASLRRSLHPPAMACRATVAANRRQHCRRLAQRLERQPLLLGRRQRRLPRDQRLGRLARTSPARA